VLISVPPHVCQPQTEKPWLNVSRNRGSFYREVPIHMPMLYESPFHTAATDLIMAFQYDSEDGGFRDCSAMTFSEWQKRNGRALLDRSYAAAER
jgi:hypothetical protein